MFAASMTRSHSTWISSGLFAVLVCLLSGYLAWVAIPFDSEIKVHDAVGLSEQDVAELINHAREVGAFREKTIKKLEEESRWTPWSRGHLFMSIRGNKSRVKVTAGFYGGPLYGGGCSFIGVETEEGWKFEEREFWVSSFGTRRHLNPFHVELNGLTVPKWSEIRLTVNSA